MIMGLKEKDVDILPKYLTMVVMLEEKNPGFSKISPWVSCKMLKRLHIHSWSSLMMKWKEKKMPRKKKDYPS